MNKVYDKYILTLNKYGVTSKEHNEITEEFIKFASENKNLLEIGTCFGFGTIAALKKNAKIIANDICEEHLDELYRNCPENLKKNLLLKLGRFPYELEIPNNSLDGILASEVVHFLKGEEIEYGAKMMYNWLKKNGKVFISASTVYLKHKIKLQSIYQENKAKGLKWPGEIKNTIDRVSHPLLKNIPIFCHYLEENILKNIFIEAGFHIEEIKTFTSKRLTDEFKLDGRESIILIGKKN